MYATICLQSPNSLKSCFGLQITHVTPSKQLERLCTSKCFSARRQQSGRICKKKNSTLSTTRETSQLQSERHNYREGLHPSCLSARLRNGPPVLSGTDELAGSPSADLATSCPPTIRGQRAPRHLHPSISGCLQPQSCRCG